jgi:hypothetical protein
MEIALLVASGALAVAFLGCTFLYLKVKVLELAIKGEL